MKSSGFVNNCYLKTRDGNALFVREDGELVPRLDGYAIVPMEEFVWSDTAGLDTSDGKFEVHLGGQLFQENPKDKLILELVKYVTELREARDASSST